MYVYSTRIYKRRPLSSFLFQKAKDIKTYHPNHTSQSKPLTHSIMATQKAILVSEIGKPVHLSTRPIPTPNPDEILIKVSSAQRTPQFPFSLSPLTLPSPPPRHLRPRHRPLHKTAHPLRPRHQHLRHDPHPRHLHLPRPIPPRRTHLRSRKPRIAHPGLRGPPRVRDVTRDRRRADPRGSQR
jgi:hypothetical protein